MVSGLLTRGPGRGAWKTQAGGMSFSVWQLLLYQVSSGVATEPPGLPLLVTALHALRSLALSL